MITHCCFAFASALLARPNAQPRLAQKLAPFRPMVERSVEQSVPLAGSGPRDFAMARLSMALMHASAAAGDVEEKRSASLEGFVETDAMPRLNRPHTSRSDPFGLRRANQEDVGAACTGSDCMVLPLFCSATSNNARHRLQRPHRRGPATSRKRSSPTTPTGRGMDNACIHGRAALVRVPCNALLAVDLLIGIRKCLNQ